VVGEFVTIDSIKHLSAVNALRPTDRSASFWFVVFEELVDYLLVPVICGNEPSAFKGEVPEVFFRRTAENGAVRRRTRSSLHTVFILEDLFR
jgi:hypothetical protein